MRYYNNNDNSGIAFFFYIAYFLIGILGGIAAISWLVGLVPVCQWQGLIQVGVGLVGFVIYARVFFLGLAIMNVIFH